MAMAEPCTPEGFILPRLPTPDDIEVMLIEMAASGADKAEQSEYATWVALLKEQADLNAAYIDAGVERGLVEARKWHVESMLHGDRRDYTYYPIGKQGSIYMEANRARNEWMFELHLLLAGRTQAQYQRRSLVFTARMRDQFRGSA